MRIIHDLTGGERVTVLTENVYDEGGKMARGYGYVIGVTPRRPRTPCARETAGGDDPVYPIMSDRRMRRRETIIMFRRPSHVHPRCGLCRRGDRARRSAFPDKEITTRPVRNRRDNGTLDDLVRLSPSAAECAAVLTCTYYGLQAGVANFSKVTCQELSNCFSFFLRAIKLWKILFVYIYNEYIINFLDIIFLYTRCQFVYNL